MSDVVKKATKVAGTVGGIVGVLKIVGSAEWDPETGQLAKIRVFGMPLYDAKRREARLKRRAERRAKR